MALAAAAKLGDKVQEVFVLAPVLKIDRYDRRMSRHRDIIALYTDKPEFPLCVEAMGTIAASVHVVGNKDAIKTIGALQVIEKNCQGWHHSASGSLNLNISCLQPSMSTLACTGTPRVSSGFWTPIIVDLENPADDTWTTVGEVSAVASCRPSIALCSIVATGQRTGRGITNLRVQVIKQGIVTDTKMVAFESEELEYAPDFVPLTMTVMSPLEARTTARFVIAVQGNFDTDFPYETIFNPSSLLAKTPALGISAQAAAIGG